MGFRRLGLNCTRRSDGSESVSCSSVNSFRGFPSRISVSRYGWSRFLKPVIKLFDKSRFLSPRAQ